MRGRTSTFFGVLFLALLPALSPALPAAEFYVAPSGSDTADGTLASPFATVERAREAVRARLRSADGPPEGGVTVNIREGVYPLAAPLAFGPEDSGRPGAPVVYRAWAGERARLVGGREFALSEFSPLTDPALLARLPESTRGRVLALDLRARGITDYGQPPLYGHGMGFLEKSTRWRSGRAAPEVFLDGEPLTLARWPDAGFARIASVVERGDIVRAWADDARAGGGALNSAYVPPEARNDPPRGFAFTLDDPRAARWAGVRGAMLYGYFHYNWSDQAVRVASVGPASGGGGTLIRSEQPAAYGAKAGQRFYIYNLLEELDAPGEWFLDREAGVFCLIPPDGASASARVTLSLLARPLAEIAGASHLRLAGLDFSATRAEGVTVSGGRDVRLEDCRVSNTAGTGVVVKGGAGHAITGCEIFNTGKGGVSVSGGDPARLEPAGHLVENNLIRDYARVEKTYRPAVELAGVGQRVARNEIRGGAHMGISFTGNNHLIELNHIHDVCRETDDMGAIYAGRSWTARGTVIRHNLLRDITGYAHGTHRVSGIYLDDGFSGTTVEGNIFLNVAQGLFFNGSRDNRAENNLFIGTQNTMRGTDMSKSFTTWAAMSWKTLQAGLAAAPIDSEAWRAAWPELTGMADDEPQLPKRNIVRNNLRHRSPLLLGDAEPNFAAGADVADGNQKGIEEPFIRLGTVGNNPEIAYLPGHYDEETGRFVFDPASGVFEAMPGLREIPAAEIGRARP